jgi:L-glutamine-phosphate cytidylyltransferase
MPKCMLPFQEKRLFDRQRETLEACNISEIGVVRGYRGEVFDDEDVKIWSNERWAETNMVHSLFCADEILQECDEIILSYGDIIYTTEVLNTVLRTEGDAVVAVDKNWQALWEVRNEDPLDDAESLRMDQAGNITDIGRKVQNIDDIEAQYIGLMKFTAAGIDQLRKAYYDAASQPPWLCSRTRETSYMTDLLRGLIHLGTSPKAAIINSGWLEFDTETDLTLYNEMSEDGRLDGFYKIDETHNSQHHDK